MEFSYSRINAFHQCKYMWEQTYVNGDRGSSNAFAAYGTFMHELLESYVKDDIPDFILVERYIDEYAEHVTFEFPFNAYVDLAESYYKKGLKYLQNFDGFPEYKIIAAEDEIRFEIEDYKFIVKIDLIVENQDGSLEIVDHKSKSGFKSKKELAEYLRQLYLYAYAVYLKYERWPQYLNFNMFTKNEWVQEDFVPNKWIETKQWLLETIREIEKEKDFKPTLDEFFCSNLCNHRLTCIYKIFKIDQDKESKN